MIARQFLLCSIDIKDKSIWSDLINSTESIEEKNLAAKEWSLRKEKSYNTLADNQASEFNYRDALEKTRNFDLLWNDKVDQYETLNIEFDKFTLLGRDTSLVVDYHGNFLLIIGYTISHSSEDVKRVIQSLFKNRAVIENLQDTDWYLGFAEQVKNEIVGYVNSITKSERLVLSEVELDPDAAFPLFYSGAPSLPSLPDLFKNEESLEQRTRCNPLSDEYDDSFFHVGWNYTLALKFPENVNENIFSIMAKMQMSYYKFRYYKEYFNGVYTDILKNADNIDAERIDFFDKLKLNYSVFLANYFKFKYGLYPKFNSVMNTVEKLWNIDKDTLLLDKTFDAQTEFVNKKYNQMSQKLNDKQNQALNIIALLQLVAFVSVIYDSLAFEEKWPNEFYTVIVLLLVSVSAALSMYISMGMMRRRKKRK